MGFCGASNREASLRILAQTGLQLDDTRNDVCAIRLDEEGEFALVTELVMPIAYVLMPYTDLYNLLEILAQVT